MKKLIIEISHKIRDVSASMKSWIDTITPYLKMIKNHLQSFWFDFHELRQKELNPEEKIKEDKQENFQDINGSQPDDFIVQEVLDNLKTQIELFLNHDELIYITSIIKKDFIVASHLNIIQALFKGLKWVHEFCFRKEITSTDIENLREIGKVVEELFETIIQRIDSFWNRQHENFPENEEFREQIRRHKDFIIQKHGIMIVEGMQRLWRNLEKYYQEDNHKRLNIPHVNGYDLILEGTLEKRILEKFLQKMGKQIEDLWHHHEFLSKKKKDLILISHFYAISWGFESFLEHLDHLYFPREWIAVDMQERDRSIERLLEDHFNIIRTHVELIWKSHNEHYNLYNKLFLNDEIRREKELMLEEHLKRIREGLEELWRFVDKFAETHDHL